MTFIHHSHLLCCTNESYNSRWWNRNVVGSFNIVQNYYVPVMN